MGGRLVRDIIAGQKVYALPQDATVTAASRLMKEGNVGALIITQNGKLTGIFTERDAVQRVLAEGLNPDTVQLSRVMSWGIVTITADIPVTRVLHIMHENNFRHVPVIDRLGAPIGMVSIRDALGDELLSFQDGIGGGHPSSEVVD